MFTKTKGDNPPSFSPAQDAVRSASSKPASRVGASIICSDMLIIGSVRTEGALQIDGKIEGDVTAGDVTVGSTGEITGEIKAETLRVKGHVNGSIRARKVELETGATVKGDIIHAALIIQPDASFEGQVKREENPLLDAAPKAASTTNTSSTSTSSTSNSTSDLSSHNLGQTGNA